MTDNRKKPFLGSRMAEINRRYRTPRIATTPVVRFALLALRVYLIALVVLLVVKFILVLKGGAL
jgi:hypothetical protein